MLFSGKLNRLRTIALGLVLVGFIIMYVGYALYAGYLGSFFAHNIYIMGGMLIIGFFGLVASSVMYMWIGLISTKATQVYCPKCGKVTKVVGLKDECMFCKQALSLDPKDKPVEPVESEED